MLYPNVSWKKYLDSPNPTIIKYLSNYGDEFLHQTFQRLKLAHSKKKIKIILFKFKDSDIVCYISKSEYIPALEKLLQLCINLEKYELCKEIHTTLKLIKLKENRTSKKVTKTKSLKQK
jgi:hypothetical protein